MTSRKASILGALAALAVGFVMISGESVWIDEVQTEQFAAQPTFGAWLESLKNCTRSQAQMPLGMFAAWIGGKTLGVSEWQLRAANLLWLALAGAAAALIAQLTRSWAWLALFLLSPFLWFYTNEARPYVMLICAGVWLLYFLLKLHRDDRLNAGTAAGLIAVSVFGYATHALFAFVVMGVAAAALPALWQRREQITKTHIAALLAGILGVAALSAYYAWTVKHGAAGARIWKVGAGNILFTGYELLGFIGLGPPRNDLREMARGSGLLSLLKQPQYFGLAALGLLYGILALLGWRARKDPLLRASVVVTVVGGGCLFAAALAMRFPFWGRHAAGLLPFVLFAAWRVIASLQGSRRLIMAGLLALAFTASAARLRYDPAYGKEDYRSACRLALTSLRAGLTVWWSADPEVPDYYGLPRSGVVSNQSPAVIEVVRVSASELGQKPRPDLVVTSKPDIHDDTGAVRDYIVQAHLTNAAAPRGFQFWLRPGVKIP